MISGYQSDQCTRYYVTATFSWASGPKMVSALNCPPGGSAGAAQLPRLLWSNPGAVYFGMFPVPFFRVPAYVLPLSFRWRTDRPRRRRLARSPIIGVNMMAGFVSILFCLLLCLVLYRSAMASLCWLGFQCFLFRPGNNAKSDSSRESYALI